MPSFVSVSLIRGIPYQTQIYSSPLQISSLKMQAFLDKIFVGHFVIFVRHLRHNIG